MRFNHSVTGVGVPVIGFLLLAANTILVSQPEISREKLTLLKVVAGIQFTFTNCADEIWSGYDLSTQPYIAYLSGEFVLYLNARHAPADFKPYPSDFPPLGTIAFIHEGPYRDLAGQFAFDFQIDSITTFAMGLPKSLLFSLENPSLVLLGSTIHEGFHQYQHNHFGEIPWAREERYPILDTENTALASLEMHLLKDALKARFDRNREKMETLLKEFVAVREYRWEHSGRYVRKYEQGQEINEGTARYVEMKALGCFLKLDSTGISNPLFRKIKRDLSGMTIRKLLLDDMESRLHGLAVAPEDMLRNRIYPVGAALGFLLDTLDINWKTKFQAAGPDISFSGLLKDYFHLDSTQLSAYLSQAKSVYHYPEIRSSANKLINDYFAGYQKALAQFHQQQGTRIEIRLSNDGVQRFRSSKEKKWIVENGGKLLCLHYNLYSLKSLKGNKLLLEIHDRALLDENDWKTRRKTVTFYTAQLTTILLDGNPITLRTDIERRFTKLKIEGDNFKFETEGEGTFSFNKDGIQVNLE